MSIPLVQNNEKDSINTSIIAIKKNFERINSILGLVDSGSDIDTSEFVKKSDIVDVVQSGNMNPVTSNAVATSNAMPVDTVTSGDMHSVTSNAVANALSTRLDYVYDEVDTGIKWVNGKPIYRKVFNLSAVLVNVSTSLLQNMNIDNLLRNDLQVWHSNQMYWISNGIIYNTSTKKISFNSAYQQVYVYFYIIEYTKTTDSATRNIEETRKISEEEPIEEPKEEEKK